MSLTRNDWIVCGSVGRPWGVRGEFVVEWLTGECPVEIGSGVVYVKRGGGEYAPHCVMSSRRHGKQHVVRLKDISSRDDAIELRGAAFFLPAGEMPKLDAGEYYSYQILGLEVVTEDDEVVGTVTKIFSAGPQDVYEVTGMKGDAERTVLIPAVDHVVLSVDLENKRMTIHALPGLLD